MPFETLAQRVTTLALGLALLLAPGPRGVSYAATLLLGFDDLPGASAPVPSGYGSLDWSGAWVSAPSGAGYLNGLVSPSNIAYAFGGGIVTLRASVPGASFDVNSVHLTAAFNDGAVVNVQGFRSGVLAYYVSFTINTLTPTLADLHFLDVDMVTLGSSGGTPAFPTSALNAGSYFAMDDFSIDAPEPGLVSLLGVGAALASAASRRSFAAARSP